MPECELKLASGAELSALSHRSANFKAVNLMSSYSLFLFQTAPDFGTGV